MAKKQSSAPERVPPSLSPQRAIELLHKQLSEAEEIKVLAYDDPRVVTWKMTTQSVIDAALGKPNDRTSRFLAGCGGPIRYNMTGGERQRFHAHQMDDRAAVLQSVLNQLEVLGAPAAAAEPSEHGLHPEIERVSAALYQDGHYGSAVLQADIRVIDEVRRKSGLSMDGDALMNRAFGCDRQTPVIRFNDLGTEADRDEQRGIMYLFKGIVGLRNLKAHTNRLLEDPGRTYGYLVLASLLMRLLEIAQVDSAATG